MTQKITLIKGPPGTGKTTLFAKITHLIAKTGLKLMICGPSNIACDAITKAILKNF
jgi:DNA polymerase alpha-associated DNA helicase A